MLLWLAKPSSKSYAGKGVDGNPLPASAAIRSASRALLVMSTVFEVRSTLTSA